jgi:hypothetical protein
MRPAVGWSTWSAMGFVAALSIGLLYAVVVAMSLYEISRAPNDVRHVGYVRHGIASLLFVAICLFTARGFWTGRSYARWSLIFSPALLIVFVHPGLNVVWNFLLNFGSR